MHTNKLSTIEKIKGMTIEEIINKYQYTLITKKGKIIKVIDQGNVKDIKREWKMKRAVKTNGILEGVARVEVT